MKTKLVLTVILSSFLILGCSDNGDNLPETEMATKGLSSSKIASSSKGAVTSQTFPQAEQEVTETLGAITQSIIDGDLDLLISFHAYGPKFTEFKNGDRRNDGVANEIYERGVFGPGTEVISMAAEDLKVAVYYGNVAIATFHSNFELRFGAESPITYVKNQITLVFVKTKGEWKIVHEHHAPLNVPLN